jgi:hypothetical protein
MSALSRIEAGSPRQPAGPVATTAPLVPRTPRPEQVTSEGYEDADELAVQLRHGDRQIHELMGRVGGLEAELACYWLAHVKGRGAA